jgi:hypothetical protein
MIDLVAANHTNRELELMLNQGKPLAMFYEEFSFLPNEEIIPEERFSPHVAAGRFVRSEEVFNFGYNKRLGRDAMIKYVFFAQASEAWRIPAMKLVKKVLIRTGRNPEEMERIESHLLGYTDEEVDAWCSKVYRGTSV